jgi:hypothetical protein
VVLPRPGEGPFVGGGHGRRALTQIKNPPLRWSIDGACPRPDLLLWGVVTGSFDQVAAGISIRWERHRDHT